MDKHNLFMIGLVLLAVFVIADGIWVVMTPPVGDELQAYGLVAVGAFMLLIGYYLGERRD
ncbi:MAG: hypothetical protein GYA23_10050 [Methanomicrobiales archaeon]|nr:hypothetical protein [Methanomicrobiales archaeon]